MSDALREVKLDNGTYALIAQYQPQELVDYQGNPLIEALPSILSYEEAFNQLSFYLITMKRKKFIRSSSISCIITFNSFFQPIAQTLDLERRFSRFYDMDM